MRYVKWALQYRQFQWCCMDLLKAQMFSYLKRIKDSSIEVLKGFSPGAFNRLCVTRNKNLEQRKFRTKERANNISPFKNTSESYGCQLRQLIGSIPSSIFLDTSWIYGCQLRKLTGSIGPSILDSSESYIFNSDSWREI